MKMKAEVCLPAVCNMSESKDKDHEARTQGSGREEWVEGRELLGISQPIRCKAHSFSIQVIH